MLENPFFKTIALQKGFGNFNSCILATISWREKLTRNIECLLVKSVDYDIHIAASIQWSLEIEHEENHEKKW